MKLILFASLLTGVANASPFYFQTTCGAAGSLNRGFENTACGIALGAEVFKADRFTIELEAGYTQIGAVKGPVTKVQTTWDEPIQSSPTPVIQPAPTPVIQNDPVIVEPPEEEPTVVVEVPVIDPVLPIDPPSRVPQQPIVAPEPIPDPLDIPVVVIPSPDFNQPEEPKEEPILVIDIPILMPRVGTQSIKGIPDGVRINGKEIKEYVPKFNTDLYQVTAGIKIPIGRLMSIQVRAGAEKKVIDGQIEEKTQKGDMINWAPGEKFRDNELTYLVGGSVLINLRKQLMGVVRIDYHDHNNQVDDSKFQTDDIIFNAGLRFGF